MRKKRDLSLLSYSHRPLQIKIMCLIQKTIHQDLWSAASYYFQFTVPSVTFSVAPKKQQNSTGRWTITCSNVCGLADISELVPSLSFWDLWLLLLPVTTGATLTSALLRFAVQTNALWGGFIRERTDPTHSNCIWGGCSSAVPLLVACFVVLFRRL